MTLNDWLERLKPGPLPVFAHTREVLLEQRRRAEEITAREIAQTILADPLATLQVLHAANHRGSRMGSEVSTVEGSLMMLGISRYLDEARQFPILEESQFARDGKRLAAIRELTRRAHHAAWQARDFAVLHSDIHAEEVQVAVLLHAATEFLLLLRAPAEASRLARLQRRLPALEAEQQALGITLAELRPALLRDWQIPDHLRDLLSPDLADKPRQTIINACLGIAARMRRGWWDEALLDDYLALAGIENLPIETVIATAHGNATRAERAAPWIGVPGAGVWVPMLPGDWPPEPDDEEEAAPPAPVQATAPSAPPPARPVAKPATPEAEPAHTVCPMPDKQILREALENIEGHLDSSLNLNQMSAHILKGLHSGLGLSRILFAMVTPDGKHVKSRFTLGIPTGDPLRHFNVDLGARDLFGQLMGKMQGVWLNEGNRDKLWPMLLPAHQEMIGAGSFFAMSLHVAGKPYGLIYADRGQGECGLDPLTYTDFKMLCLQAARGLGKLK